MGPDDLNRVAKLLVDRDGIPMDAAIERLASCTVVLDCGEEVSQSPSLQAAVLTAANVACRCFHSKLVLSARDPERWALRIPWAPGASFLDALTSVSSGAVQIGSATDDCSVLLFGSGQASEGLRVTFDGWCGAVFPAGMRDRLPEREMCALAGVVAGALGVSELFMANAEVTITASRREVGLSLWCPHLPFDHPDAVGVPVEYLPSHAWCLGLGHSGQAYLWSLSMLPYSDPGSVNMILQDYDRVVTANVDTGVLTLASDVGSYKTRVAARWLEARGFRPRIVDRRFDQYTFRSSSEPGLALCAFDGTGPRHLLERAGFDCVVECGLGGRHDNFDAMLVHQFPQPAEKAEGIWSPDSLQSRHEHAEHLATNNPVYAAYGRQHVCGHVELAGKSVAVPFVGVAAGAYVISAPLRALHQGPRYQSIDLRLSCPEHIQAVSYPVDFEPMRTAYQRSLFGAH